MKKLIIASIISAMATVSANAMAGHKYKYTDHDFYSKARVLSAEPIYTAVRVSTPVQECYQEEVRTPVYSQHTPSDGAAVVGGIIGGIIGHKLGKGRGGATIAGTLVGASIGKSSARHRDYDGYHEEVSYEDRCTTTVNYHTEQRIDGYEVTYRFKGETFTTRMPYDPGKFVKVRVNVSPVVH